MKLKTLADVAVTATPVVKRLPESGGVYTLTNSGARYSIFVLHDPDTIQEGNVTSFAGTAAVIEALGGVEILPGKSSVISGVPWFHVVCATGETSTLVITAGAIGMESMQIATLGRAMTSVVVDLDANAAAQDLVAAPGAGHQLWVYGYELHANIAGTYQFLDSTPTNRTGIMPVGANGGMARDSAYPIFKCATNTKLQIKSVTCAADGVVTYRDVTL